MCGIVGFNWDDKTLIKKMASLIKHRGPDDSGYFTDKDISLGHRRLSILDLSKKGKQPIFTSNKNKCIVYNGEVYNFKEVRSELESQGYRFVSDTDTEVILNAYEEWGSSCLKKFNGMFAFAIYDKDTQKIFLARDPLGIKPLYYYFHKGKFIFGSEIKSILSAGIKKEINKDSLNKYLTFRYNPSHDCLFNKIKKLPAGHFMVFDLKNKTCAVQRYWSPTISNYSDKTKTLVDLYKKSVKLRLVSDVPLGVYLSGGIDSASIVAMMDALGQEIKTFSVNFGDDSRNKDAGFADLVAKHFNTNHKEVLVESHVSKLLPEIVYFTDEPLADPSVIPTYLLSKEVKKHVTVALSGIGGDEVFGGYGHYKFLRFRRTFNLVPNFTLPIAQKIALSNFTKKRMPYLTSFGEQGVKRFCDFVKNCNNKSKAYLTITSIFDEKERSNLLDQPVSKISLDDEYQKSFFNDGSNYLRQVQLLELRHFLIENALMHTDRMTMAFGIESRVPLLDKNVVNFGLSLPERDKIRGFNEKFLMKKALKPFLPKEIVQRKKQPYFAPIDTWIEKDVLPQMKELVLEKNFLKFNKTGLEKIFDNFKKSQLYYARQIWTLATLNSWYDVFFNENTPKINHK